MQNRLAISVLTSVYAKEKPAFLAAALDSLVQQTSPPTQVVLVCDGPLTAELEGVIRRFSDHLPLTVVRLAANVGLAQALNAGLNHCTSEWVARFDSDDICEPDRLETQRRFIAANPAVDMFGSSILEFATDPSEPYARREVPLEHEAIVGAARFRCPFNHMTVVYRKCIVVEAGGYPDFHMHEDYALWVLLIMRGYRFANQSAPLVRARAGRAMAARRGGMAYLRAEVAAQRTFRKIGFITHVQFLRNVLMRAAIRILPGGVRSLVYGALLRGRPIM